MSKGNKGGGSTALFVIVVAVATLTFFGVISWKTEDLNDFMNLLRDLWSGAK